MIQSQKEGGLPPSGCHTGTAPEVNNRNHQVGSYGIYSHHYVIYLVVPTEDGDDDPYLFASGHRNGPAISDV